MLWRRCYGSGLLMRDHYKGLARGVLCRWCIKECYVMRRCVMEEML